MNVLWLQPMIVLGVGHFLKLSQSLLIKGIKTRSTKMHPKNKCNLAIPWYSQAGKVALWDLITSKTCFDDSRTLEKQITFALVEYKKSL